MRKIVIISVLLAFISLSCSVSRKNRSGDSNSSVPVRNNNTLKEIVSNNLSNNDFFIQRADVMLTQENITVHFNAAVRFRQPDSLLVSVKSKTGIEAGRALITRDTIVINDRINRKVIVGDALGIRNKYGIDSYYIFALLGDLIVNEKESGTTVDCTKGLNLPRLTVNDKRIEYTIDCGRGKIIKAFFEGDIRTGNIELKYSDFINVNRVIIPQKIEISDDLNNVNIQIEIKKIVVPWEGTLKLLTGSGYKVVRIK